MAHRENSRRRLPGLQSSVGYAAAAWSAYVVDTIYTAGTNGTSIATNTAYATYDTVVTTTTATADDMTVVATTTAASSDPAVATFPTA